MFKQLDEYIEDSLTLPVTPQKSYTFASPPMKVGLMIQRAEAIIWKRAAGQELTEEEVELLNTSAEGEDFYRMMMGETYDEMLADGVSDSRFFLVAATVYQWVARGRAKAEETWNAAAPKAPARKAPADRKPPAKKAAAPSARRASTGTTIRTQPKKTTRATRGRTSSATGS